MFATPRPSRILSPVLLVLLAPALLSGCGTIVRGTTQNIAVDSVPQGATVRTNTGLTLRTPTSLALKRNIPHTLTCTHPGYRETSLVVNPVMSSGGAAGMAGNIMFGGLIGAAVDAGSGAMYDLNPDTVIFRLEPEPADPAPAAPRARGRTRP